MDYVVLILLIIVVAVLGCSAFSSTKDYTQCEVKLNEPHTDATFPKIWESHGPTLDKYAMLRLDELEKEVKELKKQLEELKED